MIIEHDVDVIRLWSYHRSRTSRRKGGYIINVGNTGEDIKISLTNRANSSRNTQTTDSSSTSEHVVRFTLTKQLIKKPSSTSKNKDIRINGATLHNLKNVNARFPSGQMTVITGPSGSGKTTLAFDTLFSEGQRRYIESLSTYARRFLGRLKKPPVESIEGLAPAICIDQSNRGKTPRSTVATSTEIHDYLRLIFAHLGEVHCPECQIKLRAHAPATAMEILRNNEERGWLLIKWVDHFGELTQNGYNKILVKRKMFL